MVGATPRGHGAGTRKKGGAHPSFPTPAFRRPEAGTPGGRQDRMGSLLVHLSSSWSCLVLPKRLPCKLPLFPRPTHSQSQERAGHLCPHSRQLAIRQDDESYNRNRREGPQRVPSNTEGLTLGEAETWKFPEAGSGNSVWEAPG